ncbi:MAG: AAA family ATPase [Armatimonadetes bacterium]|nr:AAA family ATPase [Armatimonadota bacterium]
MSGYLDHFGLKAPPFSTTPDPAFAYATREHQLAVAKIQYSVEERQGIFLLLGEVGCGKTTVSQFMLNAWRDDQAMSVAYITNPSVRTPSQFLRLMLAHFEVAPPYRLQDNWDALRALLIMNYREGRNTTIVVDEAQTISAENMDTLTHISNEQTQKVKLVQVVLLAQPNFIRKLSYKPALRDRIAHGSTLNPLSHEDAVEMLRHRLRVAGGDFDRLFPGDLPRMVFNTTRGIPRRLCMLCDSMLLNTFAAAKPYADEQALTEALQDLTFKGWQESNP